MPIRIQGSIFVDAPRDQVYHLLLDPQVMKQVIGKVPGITVESIEQVSENEYAGTLSIGISAIKGTYNGKITVLDRRPCEYLKLRGDGKGEGNFTSGEAELNLAEQENRTLLSYSGQGNINGRLASLGQRLADTVGRQFIDQGAKAFAEEIAAQQREKVGLPPVARPAPAMPRWVIPAVAVAVIILAIGVYLFVLR